MKVNSFSEYWIYHLVNHKKSLTRKLHLLGFAVYILSWIPGILLKDWRYIVASLVIGYLLSVYTHTFIEKSPVNLKHPYWGLIASLKMFSLMIRKEMDLELIRVFGKVSPSEDDNYIINLDQEEEYQKQQSLKISDDIPSHPFEDYWDVFIMKHQVHGDVFIHVLSMYIFWFLIITILVTGELWPIIFMPGSMLMGNITHKFIEDTYIDPLDAFASPRAMISLHKLMFLYTFGLYGAEVAKRQKILKDYLESKST